MRASLPAQLRVICMIIGAKDSIDQILLLGNSTVRLYTLLTPDPLCLPASREGIKSLEASLSRPFLVSVRPDLEQYLPFCERLDLGLASELFALRGLYDGFGLDRLAALIGAISLSDGKQELAVLDFGTFFTFTAITLQAGIWSLSANAILPSLASVQGLYGQAGAPSMSGLAFSGSEAYQANSTLGAAQRGLRAYINGFLDGCLGADFAGEIFLTGGAAFTFRDHPLLTCAQYRENLLALGAIAYIDRSEVSA